MDDACFICVKSHMFQKWPQLHYCKSGCVSPPQEEKGTVNYNDVSVLDLAGIMGKKGTHPLLWPQFVNIYVQHIEHHDDNI